MDKLSIIQADRDAAAPFQGPLADWFRGKRTLAELLPEAFAAHRIASQAELVEALKAWVAYDAMDDRDMTAMMIAYDLALEKTRATLSHIKGEGK
jgi:hypothetical protein